MTLLKRIGRFLASMELAVALFLIVAVAAIPGTFAGTRALYAHPAFLCLLAGVALNLVCCTLRRFRSLSVPVLILHLGVLVICGGVAARTFGHVATVNVYEGTSVDQAYRWDLERDAPLGADLTVTRINREFYPIPVRVGVLRGSAKEALHTLKTGDSFTAGPYRVTADSLQFPSEVLRLSVFRDGQLVGTCDTSGERSLPAEFPYDFRLVAFQNPVLKRLWVDLALSRDGVAMAEGTAEVNAPFIWNGLYFYNTQVGTDAMGMPFAGIQVVRDPGRPCVFAGFAMVGLGAVLACARRLRRKQ
ncbi:MULTISPECIES: ResB-like family cytochrome C biogenesis protein [Geobacter]|uniref:ResB-like family cytochrome C biogenesis protein n=1 Tax=Geobacter TaxID=28231 RepID=UPI002572BF5D|nr:ResB-like family cytochrome C biogenesis protein [Geobacter sulfurreducens]BEH11438.1 ResB-like family cytochrome C biogenesis protein [Geobacter sulfurreducens subsp. ethanolicus]BET59294.1 ResB-like family cytochrome C biogenesis protein [Geobacter sp. 60473]